MLSFMPFTLLSTFIGPEGAASIFVMVGFFLCRLVTVGRLAKCMAKSSSSPKIVNNNSVVYRSVEPSFHNFVRGEAEDVHFKTMSIILVLAK
jgi:hypothetical protein